MELQPEKLQGASESPSPRDLSLKITVKNIAILVGLTLTPAYAQDNSNPSPGPDQNIASVHSSTISSILSSTNQPITSHNELINRINRHESALGIFHLRTEVAVREIDRIKALNNPRRRQMRIQTLTDTLLAHTIDMELIFADFENILIRNEIRNDGSNEGLQRLLYTLEEVGSRFRTIQGSQTPPEDEPNLSQRLRNLISQLRQENNGTEKNENLDNLKRELNGMLEWSRTRYNR